MPRDANGNYTLPAGNPVISGTAIESSWANPTMEDIGNELTNSLSRTGEGGMLVPMLFADGSVGQPGLSWLNEQNTGFYRFGNDDMRASVNGIDVARWITGSFEVWDGTAWLNANIILEDADGGNIGKLVPTDVSDITAETPIGFFRTQVGAINPPITGFAGKLLVLDTNCAIWVQNSSGSPRMFYGVRTAPTGPYTWNEIATVGSTGTAGDWSWHIDGSGLLTQWFNGPHVTGTVVHTLPQPFLNNSYATTITPSYFEATDPSPYITGNTTTTVTTANPNISGIAMNIICIGLSAP